jgi:RNA polymerase sigma factor (sigma-70 family)
LLEEDLCVEETVGLSAAFMANRPQLIAFLRARIGKGVDGAEADDIMQELWLKACATESAGVDNPRSYLFRTAHNLVLNRARNMARRRNREADWGYVHGRDLNGVEEAVAERALLARERLEMIDKALHGVGDRAARIFRRYRIDGVDQRRIAEELNVSLSTVEKDLSAAYRALLAFRGKARADEG